jgi:CheY-like chemotaxis protein
MAATHIGDEANCALVVRWHITSQNAEMEFAMYSDSRMKKLCGRVLVVDDMPDGRAILSRILKYLGLEVDTAEDGQQAHDKTMQAWQAGSPYDLVLMDMQMPVMDGFLATALLRSHQYRGRIAALTGMGRVREACLTAGCDDYVDKPIAFDTLLRIVQENIVQEKPGELTPRAIAPEAA